MPLGTQPATPRSSLLESIASPADLRQLADFVVERSF